MAARKKNKKGTQPKRDLVKADWIFIEAGKYGCLTDEKAVLFRYELAREAVCYLEGAEPTPARDYVAEQWFEEITLMRKAFPTFFPKSPYLSIDRDRRYKDWVKALEKMNAEYSAPLDPYWFGFSFTSVNGYRDTELVDELIKDGKIPESPEEGGNFRYLFDEDNREKVFDPFDVLVDLRMDLKFDNAFLVERFTDMLASLRDGGKVQPQYDFRGGTALDDGLRWLALARLWSVHGKVEVFDPLLGDEDIEIPKKNTRAKSRRRVETWLNSPPFVPLGKGSIRDRGRPKPAPRLSTTESSVNPPSPAASTEAPWVPTAPPRPPWRFGPR